MNIITKVHPFHASNTIYVIDGKDIISKTSASTNDELTEALVALAHKYDVKVVELAGPKKYANGIKNYIESKGKTSYGKEMVEVKLV